MADHDILLYWGSGSYPCWRVMICLEEKGLHGYGQKLIDFSKKEHKSEEIMKLNPRGQVPTFRHGDIVINESSGICHYLEDCFKSQGAKLIPDAPAAKARVLQRMYEVENLKKKGIEDVMYYLWMTAKEDVKTDLLATRKAELATELARWENYLENQIYVAGDEFTMADVFLFPILGAMVRGSLCLDARPNLRQYYELHSQRPSVAASWPPHYKESPQTQIFAGV